MRVIALAIVLATSFVIPNGALADWTFVESWEDPLDGFSTKAAQASSDNGVDLYLYRNPLGRVMALYVWPTEMGTLPERGDVARLTPEGFDTKSIEARPAPGRVVEYARVSGPMLRDRLWHGEGQAPVGTLADLLKAPSLRLQLLFDSGPVDAVWSMDGSSLPIARALGLNIDGVPAGAAWEDAAAQALLAAMTACQFPKLNVICVQRVTACSAQISENRDIPGFEACVDAE